MTNRVPTRAERQAETRQRILDAASKVFAQRGYHGASVGDIAESAGYTTGAVYSNFGGKEDLFLELIDEHIAQHFDQLADAGTEADPVARRREMIDDVRTAADRLTKPARAPRTAAGKRLTAREMMMLSLEFILYAVRERPELHKTLGERWRRIDRQTSKLFGGFEGQASESEGQLTANELAIVHACFIEGLGLRLLNDPGLLSAQDAARLFEAVVMNAADSRTSKCGEDST